MPTRLACRCGAACISSPRWRRPVPVTAMAPTTISPRPARLRHGSASTATTTGCALGPPTSAAYRDGCRLAAGVAAELELRCGLSWGEWASRRQAWTEATAAFEFAGDAAEQLVRRQLSRRDKETWLRAVGAIPAAAAFALCQTGEVASALVGTGRPVPGRALPAGPARRGAPR